MSGVGGIKVSGSFFFFFNLINLITITRNQTIHFVIEWAGDRSSLWRHRGVSDPSCLSCPLLQLAELDQLYTWLFSWYFDSSELKASGSQYCRGDWETDFPDLLSACHLDGSCCGPGLPGGAREPGYH